MLICLQRGASDLHMVQLIPLPPHHLLPEWFIHLVPAYPRCPGKKPLNRCVCVCVCSWLKMYQFYQSFPTADIMDKDKSHFL